MAAGKKARIFYEVACSVHGVQRGTDHHRSVKVGEAGCGKILGCPACKLEEKKNK